MLSMMAKWLNEGDAATVEPSAAFRFGLGGVAGDLRVLGEWRVSVGEFSTQWQRAVEWAVVNAAEAAVTTAESVDFEPIRTSVTVLPGETLVVEARLTDEPAGAATKPRVTIDLVDGDGEPIRFTEHRTDHE